MTPSVKFNKFQTVGAPKVFKVEQKNFLHGDYIRREFQNPFWTKPFFNICFFNHPNYMYVNALAFKSENFSKTRSKILNQQKTSNAQQCMLTKILKVEIKLKLENCFKKRNQALTIKATYLKQL